ncbi:MAG TPA: outer membrane beta-barrel protein [Terriglobia bacterium]|nr:outer membrane beta-barrel protein [Terriglobia bacterium]
MVIGCLLLGLSSAQAGSVFGDLRGVTRNSQGAPLPGVRVSVHGVADNTELNTVSNEQGVFLVANVKPGRYQLKATKEGLASSAMTTVSVAPQQDLRVVMTLAPLNPSKAVANPKRTPTAAGNSTASLLSDQKLLLEQLEQRLKAAEAARADQDLLLARLEQRLEAMEVKEAKGASPAAAPAQPTPVASWPPTSPATTAATQPAPVATPAKAGASTPPNSMIASLEGSAGVNPKQEAKEEAMNFPMTPTPGTPSAPKPVVPSVAVATPAAPPQEAAPAPPAKKFIDPFSDWDWTWLNGNPRTKDIYWDSKFFTPEIRADINYVGDFNHPSDHSMGGSSELFRTGEVQVEQLGVGGDFHYDNVRARLMTQFGMYSITTPRNDASPGNGQWDTDTAYRYLAEAYGGYHFNWRNGINIDAGIFMSYIGLFSYYNFDNWAYQPSYVSSNTPWFFNGVRLQIFPTAHFKIEPWFINGWQSYDSANDHPGAGGQLKWTPYPWLNLISNNYGLGHDDLYVGQRTRLHTDNSQEIKYYERPKNQYISKMAASFTEDLGCEYGAGVSCTGDHAGGPKQSFIGYMIYNRFWLNRDKYGCTVGGGKINNPGRYLVLLPPIDGLTAPTAAANSPYFTENPGDPFKAWDSSVTFDWMPKQYITFRWEYDYRHANVPYWTGRGGITPPGGNNGNPSAYACNSGAAAYNSLNNTDLTLPQAQVFCAANGNGGVWFPDLRKDEAFVDISILVKF